MTARGPLAPLAGVPGLRGTLARATTAALVQTAGLVLLAGGLSLAIARVTGLAEGSAAVPLAVATAGAALRAVAGSLGELRAERDARRAEDELRRSLLDRLAASPAAVAAAGGPGPAAVLATTRLHELGPGLATYLPALAQTLVVPPALLLVLAWLDLRSALLVAATLPLVPLFMVLVGKHTRDETTAAARALDRIAASVAELVRGLPVLVGLGRAADQATALADLGSAHRRRTLTALRTAFLSALVLELIATLSVALVAVTVGLRLVHGGMPLAVGLTALLLAPEAFAPLRALGAAHHANEEAALAATEARAVLAEEDPDPVHTEAAGSELSVHWLSVRYPGRRFAALPATDLVLRPGELVALTGASGSGKSTLLAVLAGVLPPTADVCGTVRGVPAGGVAYVPQHPRTTGETVADELRRHAGGGHELDDDAVPAALARVGAAHLGRRACATLSPGELQRVALARALLRVRCGAGLLLLDEPTAHLDDDATDLIGDVLAGLRGSVTILLVTHDASLVRLAERTVALPSPALALGGNVAVSPEDSPYRPGEDDGSGDPADAPAAAPVGAATVPHALRWPRAALLRAVATGTLSAGSGIALTAVSGWLIVRAAQLPPVLTLMVAIVGVRAFGLSRAGLRWAERMTAHDAALQLAERTRVRVWRALAAQGIAADRTPGSALGRVVGDIKLLQDLSVRVHPPVLVAATVSAGTVGVLAVLDPAAGAAVGAVLAAAVALTVLVHRRVDAGAARHEAALRVAALRETTTVLEGAGDLRAHGLAAPVADDLYRLARRQGALAHTDARAGALGSGLVVLGTGLAAVAAAAVAGAHVGGPVVAVLALAPLALAEPLSGLVGGLQRRGSLSDAADRLDAVLAAPVAADPAVPEPVPAPVTSLTVDDLAAGWPGGPEVLRDISARARAGDGWLVVRGPSGAGKSTFLAVLMAALRPWAGRYAVDGVAIKGIAAERIAGDDLRSRLAWLPQEAHVFASSIRANLALAAPRGALDGPAGTRRMHSALTAVGLHGLLAGLPHGLDTPVGAGGTALSGGERRRLAAARALLADRDVVLLDEPTAHLDPPTAAALLRDLRAVLAGRVVVCVTHDDSVERPGDTVIRLGEPAVVLAA